VIKLDGYLFDLGDGSTITPSASSIQTSLIALVVKMFSIYFGILNRITHDFRDLTGAIAPFHFER
jgi:hypothetical protein